MEATDIEPKTRRPMPSDDRGRDQSYRSQEEWGID
jgi:hypothetical protein